MNIRVHPRSALVTSVCTFLGWVWAILPNVARWILIWLGTPKVMVGVSGVILNEQDEVLVVRHRFHPIWPWGLPGGWLHRGELLVGGWQREVREETNLEVSVNGVIAQHSTALSMEFILLGRVTGGECIVDGTEVLEARFVSPHDLPSGLHDDHVLAIQQVFSQSGQMLNLPAVELARELVSNE